MRDQQDRDVYFRYLSEAQKYWDWIMLSFALMSTHNHLGCTAGNVAPKNCFKRTHGRFARYWHNKYGGLGPVFADRPANYEIRGDRVAKLIVYHHRNPVEAGVVPAPADSRWTSHRYYLRLEKPPAWLDVEQGLALCGFADSAAGRALFDDFVRSSEALDTGSESNLWLAPDGKAETNGEIFVPTQNPLCLNSLRALVAKICRVGPDDIYRHAIPTRTSRLVFAEAARLLGASLRLIAAELGISRSGVGRIFSRNQERIGEVGPIVKQVIDQWCSETQHVA
jgi:hypothetical protein